MQKFRDSDCVLSHLQPSFLHDVPNGVVVGHEAVLELETRLTAGHRAVPAMDEDV